MTCEQNQIVDHSPNSSAFDRAVTNGHIIPFTVFLPSDWSPFVPTIDIEKGITKSKDMNININLIGNCIPILFTILNFQYAAELTGKRKLLCILSVVYSIIGSITIVLLNSNNKQAAFEWFVLYSLGFFVFRFIRKKSANLLSVATDPQAFDTRDYSYHKIVLIKNMLIALLIFVFAFSPLFDKLFSGSEIYGLSRYNYVSCGLAYTVYCIFLVRTLKKRSSCM